MPVSLLLTQGVYQKAFVTDFGAAAMELEESRRSRVGENTSEGYSNNQVRFLQWLSVNRPMQLNRAWVSLVYADARKTPLPEDANVPAHDKEFKRHMKARCMKYDRAVPPLSFAAFSTEDALVYFQELKVQARSKGPHRSAIRALFTHYNQAVPAGWEDSTQAVFAGMKRREAKARQNGVLVAPNGKRHRVGGKKPLTFQMYDTLSKTMYQREARPFKILFVLLCWNLMARSSSIDNICLEHLDWTNDALTILFCHTKTNQTGQAKGLHPRHVYANPFCPQICPILALGIYFLTNVARSDSPKLFHSSREYDRVLGGLRKTIESVSDELMELVGMTAKEWALHSYRKGSASYASNGPCAVHKSISDNRGGWTQAGQGDVYYGYVPEGDQLIGRVLSGLPMSSPNFAILPPMFRGGILEETVMKALRLLFPTYMKPAGEGEGAAQRGVPARILSFCLASVVFHYEWLDKTLVNDHPLRTTPLFTDANLLNSLRGLVECRRAGENDNLQPTGVPGTINHLVAIERASRDIQVVVREVAENKEFMAAQSQNVINVLGAKVEELGEFVLAELDKRQVESHLTPHGMREVAQKVVSDVLQQNQLDKIGSKLDALLEGLKAKSVPCDGQLLGQSAAPAANGGAFVNIAEKTYVWGGKIRMLPENFVLPTENHSPALMWNLFIIGDQMKGIPPLKKVAPWNCPKQNGAYKRYCEFNQLMQVVKEEVVKQGAWTDEASAEAASRMFEIGKKAIELPSKSSKGYNVRPEQRAWTTVWKEIRRKSKGGQAPRRKKRVTRKDLVDSADEESDSDSEVREEVEDEEVRSELSTRRMRSTNRGRPIKKRAR